MINLYGDEFVIYQYRDPKITQGNSRNNIEPRNNLVYRMAMTKITTLVNFKEFLPKNLVFTSSESS
jgi:hypothetical protein